MPLHGRARGSDTAVEIGRHETARGARRRHHGRHRRQELTERLGAADASDPCAPARVAAYVAIWVPLGVLLAGALALQGGFALDPSRSRSRFRSPSPMGFLCLSAYYADARPAADAPGICRGHFVTALAAAFLTCAVWLLLARGWLTVVAALVGIQPDTGSLPSRRAHAFRLRTAVVLARSRGQRARHDVRGGARRRAPRPRAAGAGARGGAAGAARAARSALPVQQPELDQRADRQPTPPRARRMCLLLADFLRDTLALGSRARIALGRRAGARPTIPGDRAGALRRPPAGRRRRCRAHGACLRVRRCCCSRWSRTRSRTASRTCSRAASITHRRRAGAALAIVVENPGGSGPAARGPGTGLGLANVRDAAAHAVTARRTRASTRPTTRRAFRVRVELPLEAIERSRIEACSRARQPGRTTMAPANRDRRR